MMSQALFFIFRLEYIIQLIAAELLAARGFQKRPGYPWRLLLSCLAAAAAYYELQSTPSPFAALPTLEMLLMGWKYLVVFGVTVLCLLFCYRENVWSVLFCCSAAQATQHLAHRVRDLVLTFLGPEIAFPWFLLLTAAVFPAVYAALYCLFFRKMRERRFPNINNKSMIFTVTACVILCLFIGVHDVFESAEARVTYDLTTILVCFFILCYQFGFLDHSYQQMEYEALQRAFADAQKQYELTREKIEIINIKCHDIRKQIRFLGREAKVDEDALREIADAVNIYDATIDTGSQVLDVILTDKSIYCDRNKIRFGCMIDGKNLGFISSMDMASLFGNLIDNAIEAVMKLRNPEKAIINLTVRTVGGLVMIHCENYYQPGLTLENGLPATTKADKNFHGFGMKSIRFVVEKYGGAMVLSPEEDVFSVNISIPIPA